jgi:hypothetical protein
MNEINPFFWNAAANVIPAGAWRASNTAGRWCLCFDDTPSGLGVALATGNAVQRAAAEATGACWTSLLLFQVSRTGQLAIKKHNDAIQFTSEALKTDKISLLAAFDSYGRTLLYASRWPSTRRKKRIAKSFYQLPNCCRTQESRKRADIINVASTHTHRCCIRDEVKRA